MNTLMRILRFLFIDEEVDEEEEMELEEKEEKEFQEIAKE